MGIISDWFIGDEIKRGQELDRQILELNRQKEAKGVITAGQRRLADENLLKEDAELWTSQINRDFDAGLQEGYVNVTGGIKAAINAPARFLWDSIPLWVWVLGIGWIAWQVGPVNRWLRKVLA
jgi:hypothetical protein